jgi:hypothetical protein
LGVLLAGWGVVGLLAFAPTELPRAGEIRIDVPVLVFSLFVSMATGALFGVIPALVSARVDVRDLELALTILGSRAAGLILSGMTAPFPRLSARRQDTLLRRWSTSPLRRSSGSGCSKPNGGLPPMRL